jgi:hypothetical protein
MSLIRQKRIGPESGKRMQKKMAVFDKYLSMLRCSEKQKSINAQKIQVIKLICAKRRPET